MTPPNVALYDWIRRGFDFRGRSSRSAYWWPRLFVFGVNLALLLMFFSPLQPEQVTALMEWLSSSQPQLADLDMGPLPSLSLFALVSLVVFGLATFFPDLSISWRRFHDLGQPGWLHLIFFGISAFLPFAMIAEYIWFARAGTDGPNRYGDDPLKR